MITGFAIWSLVSLLFLSIGCSSWKAKEPVGFFTGVKPVEMKDVTAYNRAVAKIWFVFAGLLEILGIPLLYLEQNSPPVSKEQGNHHVSHFWSTNNNSQPFYILPLYDIIF